MSSTNRGAERKENDFYSTPEWCVHALLNDEDFLRSTDAPVVLPDWSDPCAGSGAILSAVRSWAKGIGIDCPRLHWGDIAPRADGMPTVDYLTDVARAPVDLVLTNPPYSLAEEFIRKAATHAKAHAWLLRLNFLAGQERSGMKRGKPCPSLWRDLGTPDVYVLPKRPDFTGGGGDSCEYAWVVFPVGPKREKGSVKVLALPAAGERRAKGQGVYHGR